MNQLRQKELAKPSHSRFLNHAQTFERSLTSAGVNVCDATTLPAGGVKKEKKETVGRTRGENRVNVTQDTHTHTETRAVSRPWASRFDHSGGGREVSVPAGVLYVLYPPLVK